MTHLYDRDVGAQGYVVPASADSTPMQDFLNRDVATWAAATGAVDYRKTAWQVTLEGTRSSPVEVVDIVPVLAGPCQEPLRGGLIEDGTEGETDKVVLRVDVDQPEEAFHRVREGGTDRNVFTSRKLTLPQGEKNVLILQGASAGKHCKWRYRIDYLADGGRSSLMLSAPGGAPFDVTGPLVGWKTDPSVAHDWVVPSYPARVCWQQNLSDHQPKIDGRSYSADPGGTCA